MKHVKRLWMPVFLVVSVCLNLFEFEGIGTAAPDLGLGTVAPGNRTADLVALVAVPIVFQRSPCRICGFGRQSAAAHRIPVPGDPEEQRHPFPLWIRRWFLQRISR